MAEATAEPELELICTVCFEPFIEPKVLPCCHTFCKRCLEGILEKTEQREKLACPQCIAEHNVPEKGIEGFLTDYTVKSNSTHAPTPTCRLCDQHATAVSHCQKCDEYLCECCTGFHASQPSMKDHKVENISPDFPPSKQTKLTSIFCPNHPEKLLEIYCRHCQCVACLLCFIKSHNGHTMCETGPEIRMKVQSDFGMWDGDVEKKLKSFEKSLASIVEAERTKLQEPVKLKDEINKSFDSLAATIEARRTVLLEEVESTSSKDLEEIRAKKDLIKKKIAACKSVLSFAARASRCTNDVEFLLLAPQIKTLLQKLAWHTPGVSTKNITAISTEFQAPVAPSLLGNVKVLSKLDENSSYDAKYTLGCRRDIQIITTSHYRHRNPSARVLHGKKQVDVRHRPHISHVSGTNTYYVKLNSPLVVAGKHTAVLQSKKKEDTELTMTEVSITVSGVPRIGARVERGPDWEHGNEDGGIGKRGTVTHRILTDGMDLKVKWDDSEQSRDYKWGTDDCYEVQLVV